MGILRRQLRSVIEWEGVDGKALFVQWSDNGDEIKNASKLIVGPGQGCIFVYEGRVAAVQLEPGIYPLKTANIPFLTTLKKVMQFFVSEHKVGIYYFRTAKLLDLKWGTPSPIKYDDPVYKFPVTLRAFGNYAMRITEPGAFFRDVVAGKDPFLIDDIREPLNARLIQPLVDFLAESKLSYSQIDPAREEIAAALTRKLAPDIERLGFELEDFRIEGTSFDEDTMRRINRIADVGADLHAASAAGLSYAQMQQLAALRDAAKNEGAAGAGMAMAIGMGMGSGQVAAGVAATPADDAAGAKLRKLKILLDQGLITQAEHDAKRIEILASL